MSYKITKNGQDKANSLTKDEAISKLALLADEAAMESNFYQSGDPAKEGKIIIRNNERVIFTEGEENAKIGDNYFQIKEENE